ncbi:hypothetical protein ACFFRL_02705 [Agromyces hippuratus]|uniref:hypothetical protein n=1 Tax=Agromyces hippuratus TaxID=286438 RepID=UPI0035E9B3E5
MSSWCDAWTAASVLAPLVLPVAGALMSMLRACRVRALAGSLQPTDACIHRSADARHRAPQSRHGGFHGTCRTPATIDSHPPSGRLSDKRWGGAAARHYAMIGPARSDER